MMKLLAPLAAMPLLLSSPGPLLAQGFPAVVVFQEAGFPVADSVEPPLDQLHAQLPGARFVGVQRLGQELSSTTTRTLVLPYGSSFPEESWPEIFAFLQHGGNLLVIGGRPFTRAAHRSSGGQWALRDYSTRFIRPLMIDQYQDTPGSQGLTFQANADVPTEIPRFDWARAFSPVIRLSAVDLYKRGGSAGAIDAGLQAIVWGVKDGRKLAAPAVLVDHYRNGFGEGRWVLLNAEMTGGGYAAALSLVPALVALADAGGHEFTVRTTLPLYARGEAPEFGITWNAARHAATALVTVAVYPADSPNDRVEMPGLRVPTSALPASAHGSLLMPLKPGLYVLEANLREGNVVRAVHRTGFWIRDDQTLKSGPRLTVNHDYFELDGKPLAVIGTTYMSSEVQRLYFEYPNPFVWDQDLAQISRAGLNMIRTGWWTGWDKLSDEQGRPSDRTLRTLEAYLLTARRHNLPVQFTFFAFLPEVLGGGHPYLDPVAVARQHTLVSSVVGRFHDVPWLAWDFINEPSLTRRLWTMRPGGDEIELKAWNTWLDGRYRERAALAAAWNLPVASASGTIPLPTEIEFSSRGHYVGHNSLKVYDFFLFGQEVFAGWVSSMRDLVRASGSTQLVTVGQDEGGVQDRLSPAFWGKAVDFTTNHSWWQNDHVVWDSLAAKQPGQPMLVQETGLQRELNLDETARRTTESEAALLERKIAAAFIQGTGAIEWLWNTNSYMTESNETPIGAVRTDGTEKTEADVLRRFAAFASTLSSHLQQPVPPPVAIITSQAAQYSVMGDVQLEAQRKAVRALAYESRLSPYIVAENQLDRLGSPALAILPSAQALSEPAWQALLAYVNEGGHLLVTGPIDRDEHWQLAARAAALVPGAAAEPMVFHHAMIAAGGTSIPLSFNQQAQSTLESLRFSDGSTFHEIPHGKGQIYWAAYPVELAEGTTAAARLYATVASTLGLRPAYDLQDPVSPGVLIHATELHDAVLYTMLSDSAELARIDLTDRATGAHLVLDLPAQHAALALISKSDQSVIARFGF
jgi:hypothetical protein